MYRFLLLLPFWLVVSCTAPKTVLRDDARVFLSANPTDSVQAHYIGCGGFFLRKGNVAMLNDPFFSNRGMVGAALGKVKYYPRIIDWQMNAMLGHRTDTAGIIKAVTVSHGHYDHYLDVPYLYEHYLQKDSVLFVGDETIVHYLQSDHVPDESIALGLTMSTNTTLGSHVTIGDSKMRITPVVSEHAPHYKLLGHPIYLAPKGKIEADVDPRRMGDFHEGETSAFMVDFMEDENRIDFRVFLHTSASNAPNGFPPPALLDQRPVDVLVLCVASFNYVDNYPEGLLDALEPRHVVLVHWENFFRPLDELKCNPTTVPLTNVRKFLRRLRKAGYSIEKGNVTLPNVATGLEFMY